MIKEILLNEFVIGGAIGLGIIVLGRIIDDEKLKVLGTKHGKFLTKYFGGKIGKKGWEKIESFIQKCGLAYFKGLYLGLDSDDKKKT